MQRSITLMGGIAGGFVGAAATYVINPLAQCEAMVNSLLSSTDYRGVMTHAVSNYAIQFQIDFVHFFNQYYPAHDQDFHNLLMRFDGYGRANEICWNVSNLAYESIKTIVISTCVDSAYVNGAVIGIAAGASLALLAQKFSLFKAEIINNDPPPSQRLVAQLEDQPSRQADNKHEKNSREQVARLFGLKKFTNQDVTKHRVVHGYK